MFQIKNQETQSITNVVKKMNFGIKDANKPILLLGSDFLKLSGLPRVSDVLNSFRLNSISDLFENIRNNISIRSDVIDCFSRPNNLCAYEMLASLISNKYFDIILTSNWDCLLETSLCRYLSHQDFRVYTRPEASDFTIAHALSHYEPRVKIIKLNGDIFCLSLCKPVQFTRYEACLESILTNLANTNGFIVIGYSDEDEYPHSSLNKIIRTENSVFVNYINETYIHDTLQAIHFDLLSKNIIKDIGGIEKSSSKPCCIYKVKKLWGEQLVFSENEQCSVSLLKFNSNQTTSRHFHICRDEIFIAMDRPFRIELENGDIELNINESFRVTAGVPHRLISLEQQCTILEIAIGYLDLERDIVRY